MTTYSLEDLQKIEEQYDATIIFHGTSSCFSNIIEQQGWPLRWRPYRWEDISFLLDLIQRLDLSHMQSIYLDVNFNCQNKDDGAGPYFTYLLEGALQYADYTGGETIRCAISRAEALQTHIAGKDGYDTDRERLAKLLREWRPLVEESVPVIYVLRGTEASFPDVLPKQIGAFAYQLREWGQILQRPGDFRSRADLSPDFILGKAILPKRTTGA